MGKLCYYDGQVNWFDFADVDKLSMLEMQQMVKELELGGEMQLFWQLPKSDFHNGLKPLASEEDVLEMTKAVVGFRLMKVYIKHLSDGEVA
ncbi:hypothetical protein LINGRAHAP2_LOCUS1808, partial [Linum grandiflorum]